MKGIRVNPVDEQGGVRGIDYFRSDSNTCSIIKYDMAVEISNLMLSPRHRNMQWNVVMRGCSFDDGWTPDVQAQAMSASINSLRVGGILRNIYNLSLCSAVFQPPTFNRISKSLKRLTLLHMYVEYAHFSMIKTWLGHMKSLEYVGIRKIKAIGLSDAEVTNGLLGAIKHKPGKLHVEFIKSDFVADPLLLSMDEWSHLKELTIETASFSGMLDISSFKNLQDLRLSCGLSKNMDDGTVLYLQKTLINTMLADSSNCLETLHMPMKTSNEEFIRSFFVAIQSYKKLKTVWIECSGSLLSTMLQCELLKFIAAPTSLHNLHVTYLSIVNGSTTFIRRMADTLSNQHTKVESVMLHYSENSAPPLRPYLLRNKAMNNLLAHDANCPDFMWYHVLDRIGKLECPSERVHDAIFQLIRNSGFVFAG